MVENTHNVWPKEVKKVTISTDVGSVNTYCYGRGQCIWLVHGKGNAYQYWPLMKKLAKFGYNCIAIEVPPEIKDNKFTSLPTWTKSFDKAVATISESSHVIAHGIGASVIANSEWFTNYHCDLTLISPTLNYSTYLQSFARENNLPQPLLKMLVNDIQNIEKVKLQDLTATSKIDKHDGRLSVFYSKNDGQSSLSSIKTLTRSNERTFAHFKGANTDRMIKSRSLFRAIHQDDSTMDIAM